MKVLVSLAALLLVGAVALNRPYRKVVHNVDPEAKCLDGSPAAIYLSEGDPNHILMYFEGGGSCGSNSLSNTIENCYQRSKIHLGSSIYFPQENSFEGILSNDPNRNIFSNWTKAVFMYCDGAFHQGNSKDAIRYKDTQLYFRGGVNTRAHLKYLDNTFKFSEAKKVVLTGSSAGGIATFAWADYVQTLLGKDTEYYPVADSSIFLTPSQPLSPSLFHPYVGSEATQNLLSISNKDEDVPLKACAAAVKKEDQFSCLGMYTAHKYLQKQTLFIQSSYDAWIIRYGANIKCMVEGKSGFSLENCDSFTMSTIEGYRTYYLEFVQKLLNKGHNIWTISCAWHAMAIFDDFYDSPLQKVPYLSGITMQEAIYQFVFEKNKVVEIDVLPWPDNSGCAY